jgi:hypothetical protein
MDFHFLFLLCNQIVLVSWLVLIALPRWPLVIATMRNGIILLLSLLYAVLMFVYFFRVEGGGFGSLEAVRALFSSDPVLLGGWVHYLAFDLFVGLWVAARADEIGMSRFLQGPILLLTFMFGPAGLLAFEIMRRSRQVFPPPPEGI